jgi:hypothetical protein
MGHDMNKCGLPSADRTEIVEERRADSNKWLNVPGIDGPVINPTHEQYILAGWVLYVAPVIDHTTQNQGKVVISDTTWTYLVVDKDPEDIFTEKVQAIEDGLDQFIDDVAKTKKYGTVHMSPTEACLAYAGYDNPFRAEAEAFGKWKASIWPLVFQIQDDFLAGKRPEPTLEIIISELPPMEWP